MNNEIRELDIDDTDAVSGGSPTVEIGGTAGIHFFSSANELGIPDE